MKIRDTEHNGIIAKEFISDDQTNSTSCIGNDRVVISCRPKVRILKEQYKFGNEVEVMALVNKDKPVKLEKRNNSEWNTISIYFSIKEAKQIFKELSKELEKEGL